MRGSHGSFTPWYVGKAGRSLKTEVFADHKLRIFDRVLGQERGTPFLFFITHKKPSRRNLPKAQLSRIENDLIDRAYEKNPRLKNTKNPQRKTAWRLLGLSTGAGKPSRRVTRTRSSSDRGDNLRQRSLGRGTPIVQALSQSLDRCRKAI